MMEQTVFLPIKVPELCTARLRLIVPADLTAQDRAAWDALAAAAEPGAFFSHRWFLEPLLGGAEQRLAVVERDGEWIGLIGIEKSWRLWRLPVLLWCGLKDANQFLGLPLVRRGGARTFWKTLISGLESDASAPVGLYLPALPDDAAVFAALRRWCLNDGRRLARLRTAERAALTGGQGFEAFLTRTIPAKRRRRLASLARQLERDLGPFRVTAASGEKEVAMWIDRFLLLEQAGWKGKARSAMAASPETDRLFREAVTGAAAHGLAQCLTLFAGETPLAASVQFVDGEAGCGFKTCYDERYARYAPGLQLLLHVTRTISETPGLRFDSCAAPDQASVNSLWPERRTISDYCIGLRSGRNEQLLDGILAARRVWQQLKIRGQDRVRSHCRQG